MRFLFNTVKNKFYLFSALLLLCGLNLHGQGIIPTAVPPHPFDTLKLVARDDRTDIATTIYKKTLRHNTESLVMQHLDKLTALAIKLDDKILENLVWDFKADYYSVNQGFNKLSVTYYNKAVDFANENGMPLQAGIYLQHAGMFYGSFKHNTTACLYLLKAQEKFKEVGFDKVPNMSFFYSQVAAFYYHLGDYTNAMIQLQEGLKYKITTPRNRINMITSVGLIHRGYNQFPQALKYFNNALALAKQNNDSAWVAISMGNIGSVYFLQGDYARALPYIKTDYEQSLKYNEKVNATIALLRLVKINLVNNQIKAGLKQLDTAEALTPKPKLNIWVDIYALRASYYEKMGLLNQSLEFRKKYEDVKDSLIAQNNIAAVEVVKMQWVVGKHMVEESKLKANADLKASERNTIFIVSFLLIIISVLAYSRQVVKTKKDQELLRSEKHRVDEELKYTESKLVSYTENLKKNNALIETFKQQIDHLKNKNVDNDVIEHLEKLMQAHIMTDDTWMEFKKIFLKVYPNFFFNLKKSFANLSETDIRLLTLIKLQSNNREMANMLGITVDGVIKSKQRLRKKMNLDQDTTIEAVILKI
jgi:tetratricopeptide (TPR) repeat protein